MATKRAGLRVAAEGDTPAPDLKLDAAVEADDELAILVAQRRIVAAAMMTASDNMLPGLSNELTKLTASIKAERDRREAEKPKVKPTAGRVSSGEAQFDASAI